ncbi:hypothetical protein E5221_19280 [Pseudomonas sp. A2]|nr:hypothetical protein E5221_19280 [Pseudomonas sp. A2]
MPSMRPKCPRSGPSCSGFGSGWPRGTDITWAGLFAGKPAPTGIAHLSSVAPYLWERVHPRRGQC